MENAAERRGPNASGGVERRIRGSASVENGSRRFQAHCDSRRMAGVLAGHVSWDPVRVGVVWKKDESAPEFRTRAWRRGIEAVQPRANADGHLVPGRPGRLCVSLAGDRCARHAHNHGHRVDGYQCGDGRCRQRHGHRKATDAQPRPRLLPHGRSGSSATFSATSTA